MKKKLDGLRYLMWADLSSSSRHALGHVSGESEWGQDAGTAGVGRAEYPSEERHEQSYVIRLIWNLEQGRLRKGTDCGRENNEKENKAILGDSNENVKPGAKAMCRVRYIAVEVSVSIWAWQPDSRKETVNLQGLYFLSQRINLQGLKKFRCLLRSPFR